MGMDVYGRNPDSDEGEYFRASIWSWPPILDAIAATHVLPDEMVERMGWNDGAGPDDAAQAVELADAMERNIVSVDGEGLVAMEANAGSAHTREFAAMVFGAITGGALGEPGDVVVPSVPEDDRDLDHLMEFIGFCRHSGGFEVW